MYSDGAWCILLVHHVFCWWIMHYFGKSCILLVNHVFWWRIMYSAGESCILLVHHVFCWWIMFSADESCFLPVMCVLYRRIMYSGGESCILLVNHAFCWWCICWSAKHCAVELYVFFLWIMHSAGETCILLVSQVTIGPSFVYCFRKPQTRPLPPRPTKASRFVEVPPSHRAKVIGLDEAMNARPPLRIDMDGPTPLTYRPANKPLKETNSPSYSFGRRTFVEKGIKCFSYTVRKFSSAIEYPCPSAVSLQYICSVSAVSTSCALYRPVVHKGYHLKTCWGISSPICQS